LAAVEESLRIAAYNTAQFLARAIVTATGYTRADDEAHTLIRTALTGSGDIIPETVTNTLHIRLDPLSGPRHTAAGRTLPSPQRHQHRVPRHRPHAALQHQISPTTAHQLLSHVRSPVDSVLHAYRT
jgi:hypothetical protein